MQEQVDSKMLGSQEDSVEKNFSSEKQSKEFRRKENQIQNKSSQVEPKVDFKSKLFILRCGVLLGIHFLIDNEFVCRWRTTQIRIQNIILCTKAKPLGITEM